MKKTFCRILAMILCFSLVTPAFALEGVWHNPFGIDDLYEQQATERYPCDPKAGETVYIKSTIKTSASANSREIVLQGIHQAPCEAEHANLTNVSTNTDHTGYLGDAFVDGFAEIGDSVEFVVYADQAGTAALDIRYSAGTEAGQRMRFRKTRYGVRFVYRTTNMHGYLVGHEGPCFDFDKCMEHLPKDSCGEMAYTRLCIVESAA